MVLVTMPRPVLDAVPVSLPHIFRVQSVVRQPSGDHGHSTRAVIYHERATLTVEWRAQHVDVRVAARSLVTIRWLGNPVSVNGAIQISRLVVLDKPEAEVNLFDLVPPGWVKDRELVAQGRALVQGLPRGFRHLFNAIFWDGLRFHRFLSGPSSLKGHHNGTNGNLRHSVEVAEQALMQGRGHEAAYPPILALGGLLHDAGKAEEYRYDMARKRFELSVRGQLIGHKNTLLEWMAVARAQHRVILPEEHYLALVHALTAVKGAPDWLGMRIPRRLEASILARVDGLSGDADLFGRHTPAYPGFGSYHAHLGAPPYSIGGGASGGVRE
jgi:3'-5' exoribonuclease